MRHAPSLAALALCTLSVAAPVCATLAVGFNEKIGTASTWTELF